MTNYKNCDKYQETNFYVLRFSLWYLEPAQNIIRSSKTMKNYQTVIPSFWTSHIGQMFEKKFKSKRWLLTKKIDPQNFTFASKNSLKLPKKVSLGGGNANRSLGRCQQQLWWPCLFKVYKTKKKLKLEKTHIDRGKISSPTYCN